MLLLKSDIRYFASVMEFSRPGLGPEAKFLGLGLGHSGLGLQGQVLGLARPRSRPFSFCLPSMLTFK